MSNVLLQTALTASIGIPAITSLQGAEASVLAAEAEPVWVRAVVSVLTVLYGHCRFYVLVDAENTYHHTYNASEENDIRQRSTGQEGGVSCPAVL
jgi:hypothetical protein